MIEPTTNCVFRRPKGMIFAPALTRIYAYSCLLLSAIIGCDRLVGPSGGGSIHIPPSYIVYGKPTSLSLELTTWGNDSGNIECRYTKIICHYRTNDAIPYANLIMNTVKVESRKLTVECELPAISPSSGDKMEYYFDFYFDGVYNQRESPSKPFVVPLKAGA